jgi:uncharacterized membrane protein (UPF0127 family)
MMILAFLATAFLASSHAGEGGAGGATDPATSREAQEAARLFAGAPRAEVRLPGGRVIAAEMADTPERVTTGYMYRTEVRADEGMIFVFGEPGVHAFWMKNTLVPLDMIWLDGEFNVVYVQPSAPPCKADPCPSFGPPRKASYVLELRAGSAQREGLKIGSRLGVVFPGGGGGGR